MVAYGGVGFGRAVVDKRATVPCAEGSVTPRKGDCEAG